MLGKKNFELKFSLGQKKFWVKKFFLVSKKKIKKITISTQLKKIVHFAFKWLSSKRKREKKNCKKTKRKFKIIFFFNFFFFKKCIKYQLIYRAIATTFLVV